MIVVVVHFATLSDATAELATPLVVALAVVGPRAFPAMAPRRDRRLGGGRPRPASTRIRRSRGALRDSDLRRLHQARRHGDLARDHRPRDGARPQPDGLAPSSYEATLAVNLPAAATRSASSCRSASAASSWARTGPGSSSRTWPSWRRCSRSALRARRAAARARGRLRALTAFVASQAALLFGVLALGRGQGARGGLGWSPLVAAAGARRRAPASAAAERAAARLRQRRRARDLELWRERSGSARS